MSDEQVPQRLITLLAQKRGLPDASIAAHIYRAGFGDVSAERERAKKLQRIIDGYDRTPAEERAKRAEERANALQARIEAIKVWRSWYATGEAPSPSEWRDFDRRLAGDQPEATPEPPKLDPRVTFTLELLSILDATASEEDTPLEWVEGYLEHLVDQFVPGAMEAWEKRGGIDPDMAESEAAL